MPPSVRLPHNTIDAGLSTPMRRPRFWGICLVFFLWAVLIGLRLFQLQVIQYKSYKEKAGQQQQRNAEIPARRGDLLDRNHELLATTVQVDSVYAVPVYVSDKPTAAHELAAIVHVDPQDASTSEEQIAARLNSGRSSVRIARAVSAEMAAEVMKLGVKGVYLQKEFQRSYPNNEIAAQMLGYVGVDDAGLSGLELKFDSQLHGAPGHENKALDARRHVIGSTINNPIPGQNLALTIDENIQYRAERALDRAMARTQAQHGVVVIQEVHTGQILALAVRPTFNPNRFRFAAPDLLRNHAISDVYEPGSTFKLVTYSAALEAHVTSPDDRVDCQGGAIKMPGGRVIHDDKGDHFGVITVHEALEHSSDVAAVKLAMRVGDDKFYKFIRDFGFGARTGIEMPGETRGLLQPVSRWSPSSIGSISIGQEVAVTPVQLVSMVSAIANGGVYLPPRVLMPGQVGNAPNGALKQPPSPPPPAPVKFGGELPNPLPVGAHRVISTMTAAQMRKMMEGVVLYGTGRAAQLNGYSSGGKTGTAQKIDPNTHRYNPALHVGSFAGFAPVNNPVIAVAVVIDSPKGGHYYGADVAAPVFAEVAQQVLEYLGAPHDIPARMHKMNLAAPREAAEDEKEHTGDANALYAAANELPNDDPMRNLPALAVSRTSPVSPQPAKVSAPPTKPAQPAATPASATQSTAVVRLNTGKRMQVPALVGLPLRKVVEKVAAAGLEVEIKGDGMARQQAPPPGTLVPPGTHVVVICGR